MLRAYAIVRTADAHRIADDLAVTEGADGGPLTAVSHDDLAVIVERLEGRVHAADSSPDPGGFMRVVSGVHDAVTCVPVRAGEAIDEDGCRRLLRAGSARFDRLLRLIDGCDEWSVRIEAASPATEVTAAEQAGGRGYLERRRAEFDGESGITGSISVMAASLSQAIGDLAADSRVFAAPGGAANVAMLVKRSNADRWTRVVQRLGDAAGIEATITGPWPAFSSASP